MSRAATMTSLPASAASSAALAHGVKRAAQDSLEDEQRFTKRFNLLHIDGRQHGKSGLYIPVGQAQHIATQSPTPAAARVSSPTPITPASTPAQSVHAPAASNDGMAIDETPTRIYIHDLDAELAGTSSSDPSLSTSTPGEHSEAGSDKLIFLPDIDRALSAVPAHILRPGRGPEDAAAGKGMELVLYDDPAPTNNADGVGEKFGNAKAPGSDVVRRVLDEAKRRRAEEWARRTSSQRQAFEGEGTEKAHGFGRDEYGVVDPHARVEQARSGERELTEADPDAMDMS